MGCPPWTGWLKVPIFPDTPRGTADGGVPTALADIASLLVYVGGANLKNEGKKKMEDCGVKASGISTRVV